MKYGKRHAENELIDIQLQIKQQFFTLLLLPKQITELEKRIAKLEKRIIKGEKK